MRLAVAAALLVLTALLAGAVPVSGNHDPVVCARSIETIAVGTGELLIDVGALDKVNHVDIHFPASCGAFNVDHTSDPFLMQQHCGAGFVRVYAGVGETGVNVVINWLPGSCAGSLAEDGPAAREDPRPPGLISGPSANIPNKAHGVLVFAPTWA